MSSAPALQRGIEILRLLVADPGLSLEEVTRASRFPKTTVARLLGALVQLGLVSRDPETRTYSPRARLVPFAGGGPGFEVALQRALMALAGEAAQTAEWFVPGREGVVLVQRAKPPPGSVGVRAQIGFVRAWQGELDAVSCLAHAWFGRALTGRGYWTYDEQARRKSLRLSEARQRVAAARGNGWAADLFCNPNGVRRSAALVRHGTEAIGILALAEVVRPIGDERQREHIRLLRRQAEALSTG